MSKDRRKHLLSTTGIFVAAYLTLIGGSAHAATNSTTFQVSAQVQATCDISASALNFGTYTGAATSNNSTLTVQCTNSTEYTVALDKGVNGAAVGTREMKDSSSGDTLNYQLYTDNTYTTVWGDGTSSSGTQSGTGDGSNQTLTVYGKLPAGQFKTPGTYSDTITATITY